MYTFLLAYPLIVTLILIHADEHDDFCERLYQTQMYPEIIQDCPPFMAEVRWPSGAAASIGNVIPWEMVTEKPTVTWPYNESTYYSLIFTDYNDTRADRLLKEWQLWFVINIPNNEIEQGEQYLEYATPEPKGGPFYVGAAVFRQQFKINITQYPWLEKEYKNANRSLFGCMEVDYHFFSWVHAANVYRVAPRVENIL